METDTKTRYYDVAVIGSGPGGYVSAIRASQLGKKVALIEKESLGGVCLNWGCIPTKAILRSAELYNSFKRAKDFGISCENIAYDFKKVVARSREVVSQLSRGIEHLMKKNGIDVIRGFGRIYNKNTIEIISTENTPDSINAKFIIIATGAQPRTLPNIEIDHKRILTSRDALELSSLPESIIIIGGGAIGVEFAFLFNSFGSQVTLIEMLPSILPYEDKEITKVLENSLRKRGIKIIVNSRVEIIEVNSRGINAEIIVENNKTTLIADMALLAVGVKPNIEQIGLENAGIEIKNGNIAVNEFCQTSSDNIYAIGDVIGPPMLAHKASKEGIIAANNIAGISTRRVDKANIPNCVYCHPQVASIGLTEESALEQGYKIKVGRYPFRANGKSLAMGETEGMVKLIFNEKDGKLLGAHLIGADVTELIAELGIARTFETTWNEIHSAIHSHPTLSEAIMEAAGQAYGIGIHG